MKMDAGTVLDNTPYDYNSIMHYGGRDFGINNRTTISRVDNKRTIIKRGNGLTKLDIKGINFLYPIQKEEEEEEEEEELPPPVAEPEPPLNDFKLSFKVDEGADSEYPFLFHMEPQLNSLDRFGNEQIEKVLYHTKPGFKDIVKESPYTLSLYTDASSFEVKIKVFSTMELLSKKALSLRLTKQQYRTQSPNQSLSQNQIQLQLLLLNLKRWKLNTIASLKKSKTLLPSNYFTRKS